MGRISGKRSADKRAAETFESTVSEQGLLSYAMAEFARSTLKSAADRICDELGRGAQSWGTDDGYVRAGLIKVPVKKVRIRFQGREVEIPEYATLQKPDEFTEATRRAVLGGLSTRQFARVGEALGRSKGLSRSTISRVSKSFAGDFIKLMEADCADIVAVFMDGIHFSKDICVLAAVGVSRFGGRRLLGLWAGSHESREVVNTALDDLKNRNLNPKLFVIDGSKALRGGIDRKFAWVAVQRCQLHKKRNILDALDEKNRHWAMREMGNIFQAESYERALERGRAFSRELGRINETARRSWDEAFPETITILKVTSPVLRKTFSTTNPVESLFSVIRHVTGRVKRWRTATHALYWCAGAYLRVENRLNKIRGYKELDQLNLLGQEAVSQAAQAAA